MKWSRATNAIYWLLRCEHQNVATSLRLNCYINLHSICMKFSTQIKLKWVFADDFIVVVYFGDFSNCHNSSLVCVQNIKKCIIPTINISQYEFLHFQVKISIFSFFIPGISVCLGNALCFEQLWMKFPFIPINCMYEEPKPSKSSHSNIQTNGQRSADEKKMQISMFAAGFSDDEYVYSKTKTSLS